MEKKGNRVIKIIAIILASIMGTLLALYGALWVVRGVLYGESMSLRKYVCTVPEIHSGYAPQGIGYSEEEDLYLMTGYDGNNESVLYVVKNDVSRRVYLANEKGDALIGHAGGITCTKDYVYIANGAFLHVYSLKSLLAAKGTERVTPIAKHAVDNNAAFCFSDSERLFVGEFYRAGNYETDRAHYFTTPAGDENKAIVSCYALDEQGALADVYPEYSISVTGLVQGFATKGDTFILSRSYGLSDSKLEYYTGLKSAERTIEATFKKDESISPKEVPLYYLDSSNLTKTLTLPSFSEDLTIVGDKVVVTNESACNKYIVGKLFGGDKVYAYPIVF